MWLRLAVTLFPGFAQMCSEALYKGQPAMRWVDFKGGGNIKLQWITKCPLALSATEHIKNPFNKGWCQVNQLRGLVNI